jgi:3-methyl-2-oxobutanoate hydroxymethyltransferase
LRAGSPSSRQTIWQHKIEHPELYMQKKKTVLEIQKMKASGERISVLTCYDYPTAAIMDGCGIDIILVGDSVGVVVAGHDNTLPVTMEDMLYHTKAVLRARPKAMVVADMPYLSYQIDLAEARRNAGLLIKEGGAAAVKLEGGAHVTATIEAICDMDIPVMGHIGLTPQSLHRMGGFKVQGKGEEQAERLLKDAIAVEKAGAFSVVLEGIPMNLAARITAELSIPTIGIGAGPHCDGQVLVLHDILGLCSKYSPKFVKRYAELTPVIADAVSSYIADVKGGSFPEERHSFS